jgi:hypothetical protein
MTSRLPSLIRELVGDECPIQINTGGCADIATILWERHRELNVVSDEDMGGREYTHTFIEHQGRYYDAEAPDGVDDWHDLPIFARQAEEPQCLTPILTDWRGKSIKIS